MSFVYTWNATFDATPADSELADLGAQRIRDTRVAVQERMTVDHWWAGTADDGKHFGLTMASQGVPSVQGGAFTAGGWTLTFVALDSVTSNQELFFLDGVSGNYTQLTRLGKLNLVSTWGNTSQRPASPVTGQQYFDVQVGKALWFFSVWVDANATPA